MAEKQKRKSIFDKAIDALTDRDEKAEAAAKEAAAKEAAELEARRKAAETAQARIKAEAAKKAEETKAAAAKKAEEAKAAAEKLEREKKLAEESKKRAEAMMADAAKVAEAAKPKVLAEYTVKPDDTLSHLALKYYKNATRDYWMLIYEANKAVIGDNPNIIRPGMVLQIPELPENLKK